MATWSCGWAQAGLPGAEAMVAPAECCMLTAMAYDRYVAICKPLLYNVTMSQKVCIVLVAGVYVTATSGAVAHTASMIKLSFCMDNVIHHYFCDILPLLELSCSNTYLNKLLLKYVGGFSMVATTVPITISYAFILTTILQIPSSEGRSKTFSTCGSHLMAVGIFYGSTIFTYFKPASSNNMAQEKVASVFYTTIIPMLNPLIYSLRNKDVKKVLSKVMKKSFTLSFLKGMTQYNYSTMTEFVLEGLTAQPELRLPLFFLFLVIYGVTIVGNLECCMLTAMAYDRYVAICKPLLYSVTMSQKVCIVLVAGVYVTAASGAVAHTASMSKLSFCMDNVIHHYFCDILPLLELSCSNTYLNKLLLKYVGGFSMVATTVPITISYAFILTTILQIPSSEGRSKTFSTCGSHLMAVGIFYGSTIFTYFKPASSNNMAQEKVASVFYTTIIPMLNPLIYSLRNKDVKKVLSKVMKKRYGSPYS
ncbi:Olfactory receptor 8D1 [Fukomys damarensis]|uniref:Olfactory receptor 8D1 n=1 Tax=Fukomys damarensis TaxID=885580 RepID=A0A091CQJ5_FUKDA|nr:Olfactory receptor 8D1 [Fukomys damarensis]